MSGTSDYSLTPNLGLIKPNYAVDYGLWGQHLNANSDTLDRLLATGGTGVFLPLSGGVLLGPLILAGDPTLPLGAVTKQYSDTKLSLAGGTLSGRLTLTSGLNVRNLQTTTTGLNSGDVWLNGGFLSVVP